jgi:hypothetical protein
MHLSNKKWIGLTIVLALVTGCGSKEAAPVAANPEPQPSGVPVPEPTPAPGPSERSFSVRLDPREAPTRFAANPSGKIRLLEAPSLLAGRLERLAPRFGSIALTDERCQKIDQISLDLLASRDSPSLFGAFQRGFQHLRSSDYVEFKVIQPVIFTLADKDYVLEQVRRAAAKEMGYSFSWSQTWIEKFPSLTSSETSAQIGASAWSNRIDGARAAAGPKVEESILTRMELDDLLGGKVGFSEIDYLCDVATGKSTLETRVGSDHAAIKDQRVSWTVELGKNQ